MYIMWAASFITENLLFSRLPDLRATVAQTLGNYCPYYWAIPKRRIVMHYAIITKAHPTMLKQDEAPISSPPEDGEA